VSSCLWKRSFLVAVGSTEQCAREGHSHRYYVYLQLCSVWQLAAKRMVAYWAKRLEIFGPERAFLPLTLTSGILIDKDLVALRIGVGRSLPEKVDPGNRSILFADPSRQDHSLYDTINMVRAFWYTLHAVLEDEDTQKKGLIMMVYPHKAQLAQFDRSLANQLMGSIRGCLPVRMSAMHLCHPPAFFQVIFPIMKLLMGARLRKRVQIHFGTTEHVLGRLESKFGLSRTKLPSELGGSVLLDHEKWLDNRKKEGK
jgi:CRAL/TRIO domain